MDQNNKDQHQQDVEQDVEILKKQYEREIRRLNRELTHMQASIQHEKIAYTTVLNQQKSSTYIMRERERYLMLLLANSPSIILFLGQTGRVEFCTDYFATMAGCADAAELSGRTLSEVLLPFLSAEAHKDLMEKVADVAKTSTAASFAVAFSFSDTGAVQQFDGLLVPMNDEQSDSSGLMLLLHDVTDLKNSREEALAASRAKSSFLSNMSHEIRTPMNAIIGMTSIGKMETTPARKDVAFERIEVASSHLLGIINDVLDISKIESGKMELSPVVFSFERLVQRIVSVLSVRMQDEQQEFTVEIDPDIPDTLYGDDQRLSQIITNLLSNATKFTPEHGTIKLTAELSSREGDGCVVKVSVEDSGIGMTQEEQSKLFNAFQQAEAGTSRKYGGTGLGLSISRHLVDMMGGDIWLHSEPGKGSCFSFTVALKVAEDERQQDDNVGKLVASDFDFSGRTVLIVDDVDINLEIVEVLLEPTAVKVETAESGQQAVDMFKANPDRYDLILMDMQMPGVDGLDATRMIRALDTPNASRIPIIAMTANVFKEDIDRCAEAGMDNHLGKPIDIDSVKNMLARYFRDGR